MRYAATSRRAFGPAPRPVLVVFGLLASLALGLVASAQEDPPPSFALRIVRLGGAVDDPATLAHLDFCAKQGFNGVWIPAYRAGTPLGDGGGTVDDAFVALVRRMRELELTPIVVINPVVASEGAFRFGEVEVLSRFARQLRRRAGVRDLVLSFEGAPERNRDLADALRWGFVSATAHVETARRLERRLGRRTRLWLLPARSSDAALAEDPPYASALERALETLAGRVGVVWSGTEPESTSIGAAQAQRARHRFGDRSVLLYDRFPANHLPGRVNLAAVLAPLRQRAPGLHIHLDGYVASPMESLGASRLSLMTIADYLRDPLHYDADRSLERAIATLAGDSPAAREALDTQAIEWGGFIGERNYLTARTDNPRALARSLGDPARVALWQWTARRYPDRMKALGSLRDTAFRDSLLDVMSRRLALARAIPAVRELRARIAVGRSDTEALTADLRQQRRALAESPSAAAALDRFLDAAGVLPLVRSEPTQTTEEHSSR